MNFLKSIFIAVYMMSLMGISGYAGWMLYNGGDLPAWGGVMMTTMPVLMVIGWILVTRNIARTSAHFPSLNILGFAGCVAAAGAWYGWRAPILAPGLAFFGWVAFLIYAYWYSTYGGRKPSPKLQLGAMLPAFTVTDTDGKPVTSAKLTGKPAILVFYRGNWCPLCMAQVKELAARYNDISALGVRIAFISPQPQRYSEALAKKFGVTFDFLTDKGNVAAKALGINISHGVPMGMQMLGFSGDTVMPTVIITDESGRVVWTHETDNYRIRPEPDVYFEVLRQHQIAPVAA